MDIEIIELIDYIELLREIRQNISLQKFEIPSTMRIHGSVSFLNLNKGINHVIQLENDRKNFSRADKLTAVSKYSANFVNDKILYISREIIVIYNPIEESLLNKSATPSDKTILFFGKITKTKGAFQVLKAFQSITLEFPDWKLKMIGGGEIALAEKSITSENKDRIQLLGYVSRAEVISAIETSAFVVIPSYFENFSMAPLEVMAKHKTIIYTSRTSGPEIISDGLNGFLVEPDDLLELENKMRQLILNLKLRNKLATNGFETIKVRFSLGIILSQLQNHYNSLIDG
jgi:glycosyltransferase involved in cell wall biosynthesis